MLELSAYTIYQIYAIGITLVIATAAQLCVFPGSFKIYQRSIELNYCHSISTQLLNAVQTLEYQMPHIITATIHCTDIGESLAYIIGAYKILRALHTKEALHRPISHLFNQVTASLARIIFAIDKRTSYSNSLRT